MKQRFDIKALLDTLSFTSKELAEFAGVSEWMIRKIRSGVEKWSYETQKKIKEFVWQKNNEVRTLLAKVPVEKELKGIISYPSDLFKVMPSLEPINWKEARTYITSVAIQDLPEQLVEWKVKTRRWGTSELIKESLIKNPKLFLYKNYWIQITAKSANYTKHLHIVTVVMEDEELHWILDGWVTLNTILEYVKECKEKEQEIPQAYVRLEILVWFEELRLLEQFKAHTQWGCVLSD